MREIKFRGIREKTGEWVYGYLVMREEPFLHDIVSPIGNQSSCTWSIKRGSEGQYTGLKDKNGVEIYEGDLIRYSGRTGSDLYEIIFTDGGFTTNCITTPGEWNNDQLAANVLDFKEHWKVIGNRFENPELLEG